MERSKPKLNQENHDETTIGNDARAVWAVVGRIAWGLVFLLCLLVFTVSVYRIYDESRQPCTAREWDPAACVPFEEALFELNLSPGFFAGYFLFLRVVAAMPFFILSVLLARRRRNSGYGLYFAMMLAILGAAGTWFNPLWLWASEWLEKTISAPGKVLVTGLLTMLFYGGGLYLFYTFPAGRLSLRITRWLFVPWLIIAFFASFFPESALSLFNWPQPFSALVPFAFLISAVWAFVHHYRLATQQELKWVVITFLMLCVVFLVDYAVWNIIPAISDVHLIGIGMPSVIWELVQDSVWYLAQFAFGLALAAASLRHQWWQVEQRKGAHSSMS